MATLKQIEANRLNAKKSTGPRSVEGKAASSMNALRSGIDAQAIIIRGEDLGALEILKDEYYFAYHPAGPAQRLLVDILIDSEWLLRRFRAVEAQIWKFSIQDRYDLQEEVPLGQAYCQHDVAFARLQRRINNAQRNFHNALKQLQRLQAEADPEPDPPADPEIGFVPEVPSSIDAAPPAYNAATPFRTPGPPDERQIRHSRS